MLALRRRLRHTMMFAAARLITDFRHKALTSAAMPPPYAAIAAARRLLLRFFAFR